MMCAESLLGELPQGWKTITLGQLGLGCTIYSRHGKSTQQDPRVKLPPDWRYRYGTFEDPQETEPLLHGIEEKMTRQWFENIETKEKTRENPALEPNLLRGSGVNIKEIILF